MRLRGLSVKAQTEQDHTITPLPSGARRMFKGVTLLLLIDLCEALPKTTKQGGQLYTRPHTGLHDLILDRTGIYWDPGQLSRTKKELIKSGVLRASADGDLEIVYDAFVKPGLYSERKERERLPKEVKASPAEAVTPVARGSAAKALGESTVTVIEVKKEDLAPTREKALADHAHANSEAKRRAKRYGQKRLQEEIRRDEHRGGDRSYAAWEAKRQAEAEEFKRSLQEPKPSVEEEAPSPAKPIDSEPSDFLLNRYANVLTKRELDELAVEQEMGKEQARDQVDEELEWLLEPAGVSSDDDGEMW